MGIELTSEAAFSGVRKTDSSQTPEALPFSSLESTTYVLQATEVFQTPRKGGKACHEASSSGDLADARLRLPH
jgi:hypothetical protein